MIHFRCEHCGDSVRVRDEHAGKSGRCPFCKAVVRIPEQSDEPLGQAAPSLTAQTGAAGSAVPPPPPAVPSSLDDSLGEDLNLVPIAKDPASETDIIPAAHDEQIQAELSVNHGTTEQMSPVPAEDKKPEVPRTAPALRRRRKNRSLLKGLLWAWVAVATAAVLGLLVYVLVVK
ncbi:MAG: hypothetical protein ACLFV7_01255 [Phycisphaerae bacterium]